MRKISPDCLEELHRPRSAAEQPETAPVRTLEFRRVQPKAGTVVRIRLKWEVTEIGVPVVRSVVRGVKNMLLMTIGGAALAVSICCVLHR